MGFPCDHIPRTPPHPKDGNGQMEGRTGGTPPQQKGQHSVLFFQSTYSQPYLGGEEPGERGRRGKHQPPREREHMNLKEGSRERVLHCRDYLLNSHRLLSEADPPEDEKPRSKPQDKVKWHGPGPPEGGTRKERIGS